MSALLAGERGKYGLFQAPNTSKSGPPSSVLAMQQTHAHTTHTCARAHTHMHAHTFRHAHINTPQAPKVGHGIQPSTRTGRRASKQTWTARAAVAGSA